MVDEPRQVAALGGVDDGVVVDAEQVTAADALLGIALLPHVGHHLRVTAGSAWPESDPGVLLAGVGGPQVNRGGQKSTSIIGSQLWRPKVYSNGQKSTLGSQMSSGEAKSQPR